MLGASLLTHYSPRTRCRPQPSAEQTVLLHLDCRTYNNNNNNNDIYIYICIHIGIHIDIHTSLSLSLSPHISLSLSIYIYICRERERERCYVLVCSCMISLGRGADPSPAPSRPGTWPASSARISPPTPYYTQSPLQDSHLFGPRPWKILATTYEQMGSWATQTLAKILWGGILLWRPGVDA